MAAATVDCRAGDRIRATTSGWRVVEGWTCRCTRASGSRRLPGEGAGLHGGPESAGPAAPEQLAQVVDRAHQVPLAGHLDQAPEPEPAEAAGLLDLAEDRLDDGLSPAVLGAALLGGELAGH